MLTRDRLRLLRALCLAAAGFALLAPLGMPWGLAALAAAWALLRPGRREAITVGTVLALALGGAIWFHWDPGPKQEPGRELAAELEHEAVELASLLDPPGASGAELRAAFDTLEARAARSGRPDWTWMLLDPDGTAASWAGRGLIHELAPDALPTTGLARRSGYVSETWVALRPLDTSSRPWRILVGASHSLGAPFSDGQGLEAGSATSGAADESSAPFGGERRRPWRPWGPDGRGWELARAWPGFLVGGLLLVLGLARLREEPTIAALLLAGATAGYASIGPSEPPTVLLFGAGIAAALLVGSRLALGSRPALLVGGALAALALAAVAAYLHWRLGPVDLGSSLGGSPRKLVLRLAMALLALGLLPRPRVGSGASLRHGTMAAFGVLILGAALHDRTVVSLVCLAIGGALGSLVKAPVRTWNAKRVCLAVLMAALAWEVAFQDARLRQVADGAPAMLSVPSAAELEDLTQTLSAYFTYELPGLLANRTGDRDSEDLAFALWSGSPLAERYGPSGVVVRTAEGVLSSFAFGLALTEDGELDQALSRRHVLELAGWDHEPIQGEIALGGALPGEPASVAYWYVPHPGFRAPVRRAGRVALDLLRLRPGLGAPGAAMPAGVLVGSYRPDGRVLEAPWTGAGDLSVAGGRLPDRIRSPVGSAKVYAVAAPSGWNTLVVPELRPFEPLERVATHAVTPLLILALAGQLAMWLGNRRSWSLARPLPSFSRRVLTSYTALVILPILLVSVFVLRMVSGRIESEQRVAGEAALESAQHILGDYVLTLEPGFGIETILDDDLLLWLADVIHNDVNLYWGSQLYASSKRELFAAGVLPTRIPGEIYSELRLLGSGLAARGRAVEGASYLEIYSPLRIPGVPVDATQLVLSLPMLGQQEEAAADLARLARRVLLVALATGLLLVALGRRFARTLTEPVTRLVEGTERIAAGAAGLDYRPVDREFGILAEAIDRMAGRVARGRERLLHEKEVVDRIVDNITAAVVSIDSSGRVLLVNRSARELLGAEIGEPLLATLEGRPDLEEIAGFVRDETGSLRNATMRLPVAAGDPDAVAEEGDSASREWTLVWVPIAGETEPSALLVVEDVTEVLRGQRLEAWAEMARMIAHEIKNPLTPIRLSTEHLREVYHERPDEIETVFERCTENILEQVNELREIAGEFSTYSKIPNIQKQPRNLVGTVAHLVESYLAAPAGTARLSLEVEEGPTVTEFDQRLLVRALRNLLENARRAAGSGGRVRVQIEPEPERNSIAVRVQDSGPGVDPKMLGRIFEPYFSTDDEGTGLGLPIARRIAEEHGGTLEARNHAEGGLEMTLRLPLV